MAKIQTLGLSDHGKKKPAESSTAPEPPSILPPEPLSVGPREPTLSPRPEPAESPVSEPPTIELQTTPSPELPLSIDVDLHPEVKSAVDLHPEVVHGLRSRPPSAREPISLPKLSPRFPSTKGYPPRPVPRRFSSRQVFGQFVFLILVLLAAGFGALAGLVFVYSSDLPQIQQLMDYRPDVMTELYADEGTPIGSFALEHRVIVTYEQIPKVLRDAVLSVEDRHFQSHWGVDVIRVVRAALTDVMEWRRAQGASTLTMQLSRMLFLSPQRSFRRKIQEVLMAIQIERRFTKPQIFTLYANQVNLGHGNFGFAAAAQFYFGEPLDQLTLPEAALLAGLPRTPTGYSPLLYPDRALMRRNQVLAAMSENGKITAAEYRRARAAPLMLNVQRWSNTLAPYFVEDVRLFLERKYGTEAVHERGLRVYTTLNVQQQKIAEKAVRDGLLAYDKRHGWRGPETNILKSPSTLPNGVPATLETYTHPDWREPLAPGKLVHGLVVEVKPAHATVRLGELTARLVPADYAWTGKSAPSAVFAVGDVDLFLIKEIKGQALRVTLEQRPEAQAALVAIENSSGAVKAMVGGYDFEESKFNRARQAARQAGSSFKVYVYAAALMEGARPFDTILDEPVSFPSASGPWFPHNYDGKFLGTITLLHALAESRNIPAVKLLDRIGVDKVIKLCRKFGLTARLVPYRPLALGASDLTVLEHTAGFTTFPNDGVRISPRTVERVTNYDGRVIDDFPPEVTDVIPAPIARLETSMLREVFFSGTATRARALAEKYPMAGKTGTTNDFSDGWFIGFAPSLTCGVWIGYDDHRTLGNKEEGSKVALPVWMQFMEEVLKDRPIEDFPSSPRLTNPRQVDQILDSARTERLFAQGSTANSAAGAASSSISPDGPPAQAPVTANKPSPPALGSNEALAPVTRPQNAPPKTKSALEPAPNPSSGQTASATSQ